MLPVLNNALLPASAWLSNPRDEQRARSIRNMATQNILARDDAAAAEEVGLFPAP